MQQRSNSALSSGSCEATCRELAAYQPLDLVELKQGFYRR